jgi:hypothetical protein
LESPRVDLPPDFDRYLHAANYHEAGFDSFVTGKIGLKLIGKLKGEGKDIKTLTETSYITKSTIALESVAETVGGQRNLTTSMVEVLKAPVNAAKSMLTGLDNGKQDITGPETDTQTTDKSAVATSSKRLVQKPQGPSGERKKVKSASQKSNIFDMLEDDPPEMSEEEDGDRNEAETQRRIAEMVKKGELLPRWEEDAEFWKLVSNRLQANACEEGILEI